MVNAGLDIVVVAYQSRERLRECLTSVREHCPGLSVELFLEELAIETRSASSTTITSQRRRGATSQAATGRGHEWFERCSVRPLATTP